MADESKYIQDQRIVCKYGEKCYQKNPDHHKKYKHPPIKNNHNTGHINKKIKIENKNREVKEVSVSNDVSDSDEDNSNVHTDTSTNDNDSELIEDNKEKVKNEDTIVKKLVENNVNDDNSASGNSHNDRDQKETKKKNDNYEGNNALVKIDEEGSKAKCDYKKFIKEKFLVDMPEDFYQFWDYCKKMKPNNPLDALKDIGLKLAGPFDVLAGRFDNVYKDDKDYLIHWRYYRDPPEFQTVLKGDDKTGYHIGYFRDSPDELPVILASNSAKKDGILHQMGANIFTAVNMYLEGLKKTGDPFKKMHIGRFQASIKKEAEYLKLDLSPKPGTVISREKKIVTRTLNKIGLVVPYNRKTQLGYRELAMNNKELNTLLTKLQNALPEQKSKFLAELQSVLTYASIAIDECDFGTGIELGWNIISHGVQDLNSTALGYLTTSYRLLNRETFAKIAEAHMANRKMGCDLSII